MVLTPEGDDKQPGPDAEQQLATLVLAAFRQNTQEELDALLANPDFQQQSVVDIYSELGLNERQIVEVRKNPQLFMACLAYARENPAEVDDSIKAICTFYETALVAGRTVEDIEEEMAPVLIGHDSPPEFVPGNEGGEAGEGSGTNPLLPPEEEDLPTDYVVGNEYDGDGLEDGNSGILGFDALPPDDSGVIPSTEAAEGSLVATAGAYAELLRQQDTTVDEFRSESRDTAEQLAAESAFSTLLQSVPDVLNNPDGLTDIAYQCMGIRLDENATDDLREAAKTIEGSLRMRSLSLLQGQGDAMLPLNLLALHTGLHPRILETKLICELELVGPNQYVIEEALGFMNGETMYGSQGPALPAEEDFYNSMDYKRFSMQKFQQELGIVIDPEFNKHIFSLSLRSYSLPRAHRAFPVVAHALQKNKEALKHADCLLEEPEKANIEGVVEADNDYHVCIPLCANAGVIQSSINAGLQNPAVRITQRVRTQSEASTIPIKASCTFFYENPAHTLRQLERIDFSAILEGVDIPNELEGRLDIYISSTNEEADWTEGVEDRYSIYISLQGEERRNMKDAELAADVQQQIQDVIDDLPDNTPIDGEKLMDKAFDDDFGNGDSGNGGFSSTDLPEPPDVPGSANENRKFHPVMQSLNQFSEEDQERIREAEEIVYRYEEWINTFTDESVPCPIHRTIYGRMQSNRFTRRNALDNPVWELAQHREFLAKLKGRLDALAMGPLRHGVQYLPIPTPPPPPVPDANQVSIAFAEPLLRELHRLDTEACQVAEANARLVQQYRVWLSGFSSECFPCNIPATLYYSLPSAVAGHFELNEQLERDTHEQICNHIYNILFEQLRAYIPRNVSKGRKFARALLMSTLAVGAGVVGFFGRGAVPPSTNAINPAGVERNDDGTSTHARSALSGERNVNDNPFTGEILEDDSNPVEVVEEGRSVEFGEGENIVRLTPLRDGTVRVDNCPAGKEYKIYDQNYDFVIGVNSRARTFTFDTTQPTEIYVVESPNELDTATPETIGGFSNE